MSAEDVVNAQGQQEKGAIRKSIAPDAHSIHDAEQLKTTQGADEAQQFAGDEIIEIDEETNKAILRKIDWHLLPIMCGLQCLQYLDKVLLSFASAMGISKDINLTADQYAWAGSIFYCGYLVFAYPHNRMLQRFPVGKYMSCCIMVWGVVLLCSAPIKNAAGILVTRFFLGAMEGSVTAGFVLVTAAWYRADEQAFRTALWFGSNGFAQIFGGIIAFGCVSGDETNHINIYTWQLLFLVTGAFTLLYGVMMWFCFADSPTKATWLTIEDKKVAIERLRTNQQGIGSRAFKWYQVREAFTDIRTYIIFLAAITQNIPNGGVTVFFTSLIKSYGFTTKETFLLSTPAGVIQIITNFGIPYVAQRYRNRMGGAVVGVLICLFGISLMAGLAMDNQPLRGKVGQLIGYYLLIATTAAPTIMILSVISTNTLGSTKKTTVSAIFLVGYCIGFLIGPQCFRDPPYYYVAKYNIIAMWSIAFFCYIALYFVNRIENKKRDREWQEAGCPIQPAGQEFADLTDHENRFFRYAL